MRATGIIRRIDDLGRVVIPKEIRRALRIHEDDALEIYTDNINGQAVVCFAKYQPNAEFIHSLTELAGTIDGNIMTCNNDKRNELHDHFNAIVKILKELEEE